MKAAYSYEQVRNRVRSKYPWWNCSPEEIRMITEIVNSFMGKQPDTEYPCSDCDGTGEIAEGEDDHEREQHILARPAAGERGQQRRADHDAQRIAGNEQARRRDRDAEIGADLQQQAHDDEFRDADAEGTGRQGIKRQRHGLSRKAEFRLGR